MPTPQLDHIVILLPYSDIVNPPAWLTEHFTISPGGQHGDGKTENKLIVFQDGTYIELIAFVDDKEEHKQGHWWNPADKGFGLIDFALSLQGGADAFDALDKKIQDLDIPQSWKPQPLRAGSRVKPDGEKIEWRVAFPQAQARGKAPFWCFDVTPRERRVPKDKALTTHPSGAMGVASLTILKPPGQSREVQALQTLLDTIMPQAGTERLDDTTWELATPQKIESHVPCQVYVVEASQQQLAGKEGRGLVARMALFTDGRERGMGRFKIQRSIGGDELGIGFVDL